MDFLAWSIFSLLTWNGKNFAIFINSSAKFSETVLKSLNSDVLKIYNFEQIKSKIKLSNDKVDAIIIGTEWNEFRALNFSKIRKIVKKPVIFDLRNIYRASEIKNKGFEYYGIGQ